MEVDQYVAVGVKLDDNRKRIPGERPYAEVHQTAEFAQKACNRMYFDEGYKLTYVAAVVKMTFNKETKQWELPDGLHDRE